MQPEVREGEDEPRAPWLLEPGSGPGEVIPHQASKGCYHMGCAKAQGDFPRPGRSPDPLHSPISAGSEADSIGRARPPMAIHEGGERGFKVIKAQKLLAPTGNFFIGSIILAQKAGKLRNGEGWAGWGQIHTSSWESHSLGTPASRSPSLMTRPPRLS